MGGKRIVKIKEEDGSNRLLKAGMPDYTRCDNTLITSKYNFFNFVPINIKNQFRRFANMYFLIIGLIMWVGTNYPHLFMSAFSPYTTWGPIFLFVSISIFGEAMADRKRHKSDYITNTFRCVVVENETADPTPVSESVTNKMERSMVNVSKRNRRQSMEADQDARHDMPGDFVDIDPVRPGIHGPTTAIFRPIQRKDIRQGHIIVVKNREMIPADMVLLASSGDRGCAYIETSSIDGETNLKLRVSAKHKTDPSYSKHHETIEEAVERIAGFSVLGCPRSALDDEDYIKDRVAELMTEPPDAHINTFTGLLTFPALPETDDLENGGGGGGGGEGGGGDSATKGSKRTLPLGAENLLMRGSVLRNTEWAIGLICFTGTDTKISQNTVESPAKFSQLDLITNKCVIVMVFVELACIAYLSTTAVWINEQNIDKLWYAGRKVPGDTESPWPYLPDLAVPEWSTRGQSWIQYAMTNITLLSYFVPLSMYLTLEVCNFFLMWLISVDQNIYDATTDTRAEPRSVTYTDLGQIQYIFSDKTGTLTQNVMRFKRCSVDGMVFGKPVAKASTKGNNGGLDGGDAPSKFLPTRQVLVGQIRETEDGKQLGKTKGMTFNAELFLRVMSLCHTVVVENDLDLPKDKDGEPAANGSFSEADAAEKAPDGAPPGYAYQAESPDEGALVSEASKTFGFQVVSRDSTGIRLRCDHPSLFSDEALVKGLKSGVIDPATVASESASGNRSFQRTAPSANDDDDNIETWSVLAINKFDSTRKRMSILLRSPPQYGSCAILLCKGADSAMIDPEICSSFGPLAALDENNAAITDNSEWESARILGLESHLGEFASEGLRTLVLGVRFLTDAQCDEWLEQFTAAATAIKGREEKLTEAALALERDLHIVGATAIEDKLQVGVPDTIATLGKAGIKLWVLTGDKRETAIEIGYSTKVLTPRMHLTEMADRGEELVRAQCAMEFLRLVKAGKLPMYQRAAVDKQEKMMLLCVVFSCFGQILALCCFSLRRMMLRLNICIRSMFGLKTRAQRQQLEAMRKETEERRERTSDLVRRRNVRDRAEAILREYARKHPGHDEGALSTDELPTVFNRAQQAQGVLDKQRSAGKLSGVDNRALKLEQLNAQEEAQKHEAPIIDDDVISLQSFMPSDDAKNKSDFDKKKRTVLERMFAVDRDVRKGRLIKHLKKEKRKEVLSGTAISPIEPSGEGPRALVIEGAALKHLQGDHILEELVFNVASQCESVIACRVTPRQKAQLVKMVRHYVSPEPVTLAIGDGANDVGMIQAAHCGIGISGKEGQQAVNASDFSIGQFRFLEDLILYHGRWDFLRTSMVVLYTFYKNAVISFLLVLYNNETLFSGTSIFDQWMMAGFSFVCFFPILSIGMFDRNLEKNYIKKNPEVYKTTQKNELITPRTLSRWLILCLLHVGILYYGQFPQLTKHGGGRSTAFSGLMWNKPSVGDGEVSDWQTQGVTIFTSMVLVMGYKVLYESRSIINGKWPAFVGCCSTTKGGYTSRLPYTLYGILIGSFGAYAFCLSVYKAMGVFLGVSSGTWFIMFYVPDHAFLYSLYNYVLIIIIPIGAMSLDIAGKVFSNMFYPSQNQIHIELESRELQALRKGKKPSKAHSPDIETSASC